MKRKGIHMWMRRLTAGILSAALILAGVTVLPATVEAAESSVVYEKKQEDFEKWKVDKTAPVKEGYLFGGWYRDSDGQIPVKKEDQDISTLDTAFAKFVPSYVLSVKMQVKAGAKPKDGPTTIRVLTGLDSLRYQYVGVTVRLNNTIDPKLHTKTSVYSSVAATQDGSTVKTRASETFGAPARYHAVWVLKDLSDKNDSKVIYVRPYWMTLDGTKVDGIAKYIHIEDAYNKYVSVPINMMSGQRAAAGVATIGYDRTKLEFVDVENGRVFDDAMEYNAGVDTVKVAGNRTKQGDYAKGETLVANMRFKMKSGVSMFYNKNGQCIRRSYLDFTSLDSGFCDWDKKLVDADIWNVMY